MRAGALTRAMHRVHRGVGSVLAVVLACWFSSGAVMTFSDFPSWTEQERLASAPLLPSAEGLALPPALAAHLAHGGLAGGARVRLALEEQTPTWLYTDTSGRHGALRATPPWTVTALDATRAAAEAASRLHLPVRAVAPLHEADQWTVGLPRETFPLFHVRHADEDATESYLSARTGELVQVSTRAERLLAWVGAIPHWIYPTLLRRERPLWRQTVLALATLGLLVTLSGSIAGLHVWRATRARRPLRDRALRWHQALGLWFGLLASSWLFSGALSLSPFQWAGSHQPDAREQAALYAPAPPLASWPVAAVLARCQRTLSVRELELASLGAAHYAVCSESPSRTVIVDLGDPLLTPLARLSRDSLTSLARRLGPHPARVDLRLLHEHDAYHYPTHAQPFAPLPYVRLALHDARETTYYLDPARARLLRRHTRATRLERWLYHGLHSLDLPGLYAHRALWRTLVVSAMLVGFTLAALGLFMALRRKERARRRRKARDEGTKHGA